MATTTTASTAAPAAAPVIDIREVSRAYGGEGPPALDRVSLRVRAGEAVSVIGPSGSGKSTLLNLIAGLDRPSSGSVTVDGVRVDRLSEAGSARYRRAKVGMVFQFFNLLDDLTVADNVLLPAQLAGLARAEARRRAAGLLEYLRIDRHADVYPGRLSGGERQRVAVARALMNRPALLLADEPTGALDTASGEDVRALLTELNADGQTIVLVTHDLRLAESCAHRTVELTDGRIVRDAVRGDGRDGGGGDPRDGTGSVVGDGSGGDRRRGAPGGRGEDVRGGVGDGRGGGGEAARGGVGGAGYGVAGGLGGGVRSGVGDGRDEVARGGAGYGLPGGSGATAVER